MQKTTVQKSSESANQISASGNLTIEDNRPSFMTQLNYKKIISNSDKSSGLVQKSSNGAMPIQMDAVDDLSENVNSAFTGRNQYPAMVGTGSTRWQQADDFIINGAKGTFHHIINKEQLRLLVKGYFWLKDKLADQLDPDDYDDDEIEPVKDTMKSTATAIEQFFDEIGNPGGASIRSFYWRAKNGYIGVRSDYRNDNPDGTDNETKKPTSFDGSAWDKAFVWFTKLGELAAAATGINTTKGSVKDTLTLIKTKLDEAKAATVDVTADGTPHRTDDRAENVNTDWKKKGGAEEEWGSANKIYELK